MKLGAKELFLGLKDEWKADKLGDAAGSLVFASILAMFPFLLFLVSLAALVLDPVRATALVDELHRVAPPQAADILGERVQSLARGDSPALLTLGAAGAIWAASAGVVSLSRALNTAYDVEETRPFWKLRGLAVLITLGAAVLMIVASAVAFVTPAIARRIGGPLEPVMLWARMPVAALLVMLVLAVIYTVLPNTKQKLRFFTAGSVVAVLVWVAASLAFSTYVANFGRYEAIYGALGGFIVLLLWLWITSAAILLGAEINALLAGRRRRALAAPPPVEVAQQRVPATIEPWRPHRGRAGSVAEVVAGAAAITVARRLARRF